MPDDVPKLFSTPEDVPDNGCCYRVADGLCPNDITHAVRKGRSGRVLALLCRDHVEPTRRFLRNREERGIRFHPPLTGGPLLGLEA